MENRRDEIRRDEIRRDDARKDAIRREVIYSEPNGCFIGALLSESRYTMVVVIVPSEANAVDK